MKRKLLSLILVVAMLASVAVFTPSASAAESEATLAFGNAAGAAGETVSVDFAITTADFTGLQFIFEYDTSRLTFDSISWSPADGLFGAGFPADLTNNAVLGPMFTHVGPYKILAYNTGIGVGNVDLSAGVVMAKLNFTIKDDALPGDAYVKFARLGYDIYQPNKIVAITGEKEIVGADMTFVDGAVTVLPAGYASSLPVELVADDDFAYEENDAGDGYIVSEYYGEYPGEVVTFPAEVDGMPLMGIGLKAFNMADIAGAVLPESITYVAPGAFFKCDDLLDVYVLNPECEIGEGAIGTTGTLKSSGAWTANKGPWVHVNEETGTYTTIHGVAGSTAADYAATEFAANPNLDDTYTKLGWSEVPAPEYTITANGATYAVPADTYAPGATVIDGKAVVAWTDGENTYAPGASMTLTDNVALEPVTITAPVTSTEADFKLAANEADLAMRFTATLSKADYATLASLGTVELGMLITPAKYVSLAGSFTKEALDDLNAVNGAYVDIAIDGYYQETADDYILAGSLKGFSAKTLAKNPDFASIVYATVTTAEGDVFTVYGDFNFEANQNVKTVAEAIVATNITNTQKGWLNTLIGKFGA